MGTVFRIGGIILVVALLVAQLFRIDKTNPPVQSDIGAPPPVAAILRRACYDCHSNQTVWPWYSNIAPVSWFVKSDVSEGREELNFSTWGSYSAKRRAKKLAKIAKEVNEAEMPPWYFLPMHPEARLAESDRVALRAWVAAEVAKLGAAEPPKP